MQKITMEQIVSWAKRRGFVYQSAELYGGLGSVWDYGPYGTLLKENIKQAWRKQFIQERDDVVLVDTSLLTKREVLQASTHEQNFSDPLVECKVCHQRFRSDKPIPEAKDHKHDLTEPKQFNLMFRTFAGPVEEEAELLYMRPETAQGMFTNFANVLDSTRRKLPFGIAQVGRSFRNEITTGNFNFRAREFEIAELEYFVKPGDDDAWFEKWVSLWEEFFLRFGIDKDHLHRQPLGKEDLAHYSKATTDLYYDFPFGSDEVAGIANRTDFDLKNHQEKSGKSLEYFDPAPVGAGQAPQKYLPYVIEPTLGVDRAFLAFISDSLKVYPNGRKQDAQAVEQIVDEDKSQDPEMVLHIHPDLAPISVAVLPLSKKEELSGPAKELANTLRKNYMVEYDETGSIGKRYRRQDEIGTPFCITFDFDSLNDKKVTVRNRDTMEQDRVSVDELDNYVKDKLTSW